MNETAENRNASMFQLSTLGPAAIQSLVKLDPRTDDLTPQRATAGGGRPVGSGLDRLDLLLALACRAPVRFRAMPKRCIGTDPE